MIAMSFAIFLSAMDMTSVSTALPVISCVLSIQLSHLMLSSL